MNNNKPLLLIFPFGLLSHYLRCLVLAGYLEEYFEIMFAGNSVFSSFIKESGYKTFTCRSFNPQDAISKLSDFDFSWLNEKEIEANFLEQIRVIEHYKPAAVLGDAMPSLNMAAEYTGTPCISLMNGYMTKYYAGYRKLPKKHRVSVFLNLLPDNIKQYFTIKGEKIAFNRIHKPFKNIRLKYGLQPKENYLDEIEGDYNLVCDLQELFPQKQLPGNFTVTGPLIYNRYNADKNFNVDLSSNKKIIYVSMGSSGNWKDIVFLNHAYFSRYNIICAGDKERILKGSHIQHIDFITAEKILPLSSLVVCHGGNGTIYQALLYKVPLLCIPFHFEQEWNADVLTSMGLASTTTGTNVHIDYKKLIADCISSKQMQHKHEISENIKRAINEQPDTIKRFAKKICSITHKIKREGILIKKGLSI